MEPDFEKLLCLGSGIPFVLLSLFISVPNGFILVVLYKNPLRCFRKPFSVFLVFITAVDLFIGIVVCSGEAVVRFLCAFGDDLEVPQEGDMVRLLGYFGINSSILLATAMSVDRFIAIVCPHFYLAKVRPRKLVLCNTIICVFSAIFASLQFAGVSMDIYRIIDVHLHTTFPLMTTTLSYLGIFIFLKKRARVVLRTQTIMSRNSTLHDTRRLKISQMEKKIATTSFLILLLLVISLLPYFVVTLLHENCNGCGKQKWFIVFREASTVFLFVNSTVNPFLTTIRINELKKSVKIVLGLRRQDDQSRRLPTANFREHWIVQKSTEKVRIKHITENESQGLSSVPSVSIAWNNCEQQRTWRTWNIMARQRRWISHLAKRLSDRAVSSIETLVGRGAYLL